METKKNFSSYNEILESTANISALLGYYLGCKPDNQGRTIKATWEMSDRAMEITHDYIQWLFPTKTVSLFNKNAPILTDKEISIWKGEFHNIDELQSFEEINKSKGLEEVSKVLNNNFRKSCERFFSFLGLKIDNDKIMLSYEESLYHRPHIWSKFNHNYLRITRMLESMHLLGYKSLAHEFLNFTRYANRVYECVDISECTFNYWIWAIS